MLRHPPASKLRVSSTVREDSASDVADLTDGLAAWMARYLRLVAMLAEVQDQVPVPGLNDHVAELLVLGGDDVHLPRGPGVDARAVLPVGVEAQPAHLDEGGRGPGECPC